MLLYFKNSRILILFIISALFLFSSCLGDSTTTSTASDQKLLEKAGSFDDLSIFSGKVDSSNLSSLISESGAYTLFAPTNQAFSQIPDALLDTLSREELTEVLAYHIADTAVFTSNFGPTQEFQSLQGESIFVTYIFQNVIVNGGQLVAANYRASNGVLHATNSVLLPDSYLNIIGLISKRYSLNNMNGALAEAEIGDTLRKDTERGYTVFAPVNSSFKGFKADSKSALQDTLKYHILPRALKTSDFESSQMIETLNGQQVKIEYDGTTTTVNDSIQVTTADIEGTNGVVHITDSILIPPKE